MKIGYLHIGPQRGGVRRYGRLIAQAAKCRSDVTVVEYEVTSTGDSSVPLGELRSAAAVLSEAEVVHFQYNKQVWGGDRRHLGRLSTFVDHCQSRLVVTLHDVYRPNVFGQGYFRFRTLRRQIGLALDSSRIGTHRLGRMAGALVVHSHEEASRLAALERRRCLHVIPHFVEQRSPATDASEARIALGLQHKKVITLLGFVVTRKGHRLLLDAVPLLPDDVTVVFAGDAPAGGEAFADDLRNLIDRRSLGERVRLTGYLTEQALEQYLLATDLAVCPFERLSASGSIATWISVAKPILACDLPQMREYNEMEPGAIHTFKPRTVDALARAIADLLPACREGPDPVVARLCDRLSMSKILEKYLDVYRSVVADTGRNEAEVRSCSARVPQTHPVSSGRPDLGRRSLRVAFLPLWLRNPYQARLGQELALLGVGMRRLGRTAGSAVIRFSLDRPQILHVHWLHPFYESRNKFFSVLKLSYSILGLAVLKSLGVKIVWTAHNLKHHEGSNALMDRICTRFVIRFSHAIIAHCNSAKRQIVDEFRGARADKVHVIPHGNYCDAYENVIDLRAARERLGIPLESTVFLFLGQVRPYKGVLEMVEAFRATDTADALLIIAGKPLSEDEATVIRQRIDGDKRIRFVPGFVPEEEIQVYMNGSDVVVLPYRNIFTSGAAVLAMSFGRACIAPRLGCMTDWFGDGGAFLYGAEDDSGLKRSMEMAIEHRVELPGMGRRNASVAAEWSWERVAGDTLRVYRSVTGRAEEQV